MSFILCFFHLPFYAVHVQFVGMQRPVANPSCDLAPYAWSVVVKIPYERSGLPGNKRTAILSAV